MTPPVEAHSPIDEHPLGHAAIASSGAPAACRPNISGAGRRRRQRVGYVAVTASLLLAGIFLATDVAWYWRALLALPGAMAAVSFLQVRRNTCIARATEGTFEHDDFSRTKAPDDEISASRRVAAGIRRDTALIGLACGVVGAASAWLSR